MENKMNNPDWSKLAEVELVYKTKVKAGERPIMKSSQDVYKALLQVWDETKIEFQEEFKVLLLNKANRAIGVYHVSAGGITSTVADPRLILAAAIKGLAVSIILAHNHPSGNIKPSQPDIDLTKKIKEGAKWLDIQVLDHLIITLSEGYYSMADEGLI